MNKAHIFFLCFLFLLLIILGQCTSKDVQTVEVQESKFLNLADSVAYVGMNACKQCHSEHFQGFMETGMGQSFAKASKGKSAASFTGNQVLFDSFKQLYYKPYWKDSTLFVLEFRLNKKEDTVFKRTENVQFIVGSGQHTNSHILFKDGYLFQAPFTYYTQNEVLDFPPGFEGGNNSRFSRMLGIECISCHNAYPHFVAGSVNKFKHIPQGINCERCHGPGALHVKLKQEGQMVDVINDTDYSIVNPRKLTYELQKDVCQRCHLQGNAILKDGKSWFDFKPGMHLSEVVDIFMPTLKDDEGSFIMASHPDRLRMSACFLKTHNTEEPLTCITCHNPHKSVAATKQEVFNAKCINCHQSQEQKQVLCSAPNTSAACISCHLKPSSTVDIPHVSVTDHYIRIYNPNEAPSDTNVALQQNEMTGLVCLTSKRVSSITKARAYLNFYEKFSSKALFLDSALFYLNQVKAQEEKWEWLVQFHFLKHDYERIVTLIAKLNPEQLNAVEAITFYRIAEAYLAYNEYEKAISFLQKALVLEPLNLAFRVKLGNAFTAFGNTAQGKKEFEKVLTEFPQQEDALNGMGFILLLNGNLEQAQKYFDKVLALNPDHENALLNSAKIDMRNDKLTEAKIKITHVLRYHPKSVAAKAQLNLLNRNYKP